MRRARYRRWTQPSLPLQPSTADPAQGPQTAFEEIVRGQRNRERSPVRGARRKPASLRTFNIDGNSKVVSKAFSVTEGLDDLCERDFALPIMALNPVQN